jgi:hypothetical protein
MANELYAGQPGSNVLVAGAPYVRAMYVWGPGDSPTSGVDDLLLQIDPRDTGTGVVSAFGGKPWYAVNDAQGDLVALLHKQTASSTVQIAAQWTYSPYGEVLTYEQFHPHPVVVFGHKSLVVDRLDTQAMSWDTDLGTISDTQRLIPGAKLIAYARNRTYAPGLGRWLQQDPNASGQSVRDVIAYHGLSPVPQTASTDVQFRLSDGINLFSFARSNPVIHSDPTGLFVGSFLPGPEDLVMGGFRALRGGLEEMISQYAVNMELDLDWALDWGQDDDAHSRNDNTWIAKAFREGAWNAFIDEMDPTGGLISDGLVMGGANHRLVPGFMGGNYADINVWKNMPDHLHAMFHRKLEAAFARVELNRPASSGDKNWRYRFSEGEVKYKEAAKMRRALLDASSSFDRATKGKYDLRSRVEKSIGSPGKSGSNLPTKKKKPGRRLR